MARPLSFTLLVAFFTALTASLILHVAWPRAVAAPAAQAGGVAGAAVSLRQADRAALVKVAKQYVRLQAGRQVGVTVDRQKVKGFWRHGTVVVISLEGTLSNWDSKKTFDVHVTLNQGAWQPVGMQVITVRGLPPIGVRPAPPS